MDHLPLCEKKSAIRNIEIRNMNINVKNIPNLKCISWGKMTYQTAWLCLSVKPRTVLSSFRTQNYNFYLITFSFEKFWFINQFNRYFKRKPATEIKWQLAYWYLSAIKRKFEVNNQLGKEDIKCQHDFTLYKFHGRKISSF